MDFAAAAPDTTTIGFEAQVTQHEGHLVLRLLEPHVPDDLRAALHDAPDIADLWRSITPMARWEWLRWVQSTRNPATRAKRVVVGVSKLRSGTRRPCCFDLAACTDPGVARSGKLIEPDAR